jgi:8-oxo-dGTP pyrophosphatase MutT (NUDIX family)
MKPIQWAGQVSFPGGHIDEGESVVDAALREFSEELGYPSGNIHILGEGQTIPAVTGTLVTPVVGYIDRNFEDFSVFRPEPNEVERIFCCSLDTLAVSGIMNNIALFFAAGTLIKKLSGYIELPLLLNRNSLFILFFVLLRTHHFIH